MLNIDWYTTWSSFMDIACIVSEIWRGNHNAPPPPHDYKGKKSPCLIGLNYKVQNTCPNKNTNSSVKNFVGNKYSSPRQKFVTFYRRIFYR